MTVDWSECDLVESVAGKVDGRPVVKGTRIPADTILTDEELGATAEETLESFPSLPFETTRSIRACGHSHKAPVPALKVLLDATANLSQPFPGTASRLPGRPPTHRRTAKQLKASRRRRDPRPRAISES